MKKVNILTNFFFVFMVIIFFSLPWLHAFSFFLFMVSIEMNIELKFWYIFLLWNLSFIFIFVQEVERSFIFN